MSIFVSISGSGDLVFFSKDKGSYKLTSAKGLDIFRGPRGSNFMGVSIISTTGDLDHSHRPTHFIV